MSLVTNETFYEMIPEIIKEYTEATISLLGVGCVFCA
jgi:hypothetical protein